MDAQDATTEAPVGSTTNEAAVTVTGDQDVPDAVKRARWERASKALQGETSGSALGQELLQAVHDRRLTIDLFGKAVDVRYPTRAKLTQLTEAITTRLDLQDKLKIAKGDLDNLSPAAKKRLEGQADTLLDQLAPMAVYFIEVADPAMDEAFFRNSDGGIELAMEICIQAKSAYEEAQNAVATFRPKQSR